MHYPGLEWLVRSSYRSPVRETRVSRRGIEVAWCMVLGACMPASCMRWRAAVSNQGPEVQPLWVAAVCAESSPTGVETLFFSAPPGPTRLRRMNSCFALYDELLRAAGRSRVSCSKCAKQKQRPLLSAPTPHPVSPPQKSLSATWRSHRSCQAMCRVRASGAVLGG